MRKLIVLTLLAAGLAACGSSSSTPSTGLSTPSTTATTTATPTEPEPTGHLSPAEYKAVHAGVVEIQRLEKVKKGDIKRGIRITKRACARFSVQTPLVQRLKSACAQAARLFVAVGGLQTHKRECTQALTAGDVSCYSNLFRAIGRSARVAGIREQAVNQEARKRKLRAACAKEIGGDKQDLADARAVTHDALSAAHAAEARDQAAFVRATNRLDVDFKKDDETPQQTLRRIATCR
jgi:hypothetical protein